LKTQCRYPKSEKNVIDTDSCRVRRKNRVNVCLLTTKLGMWVWTHANLIRPLGGAIPQIFTRVREWPRLASAYLIGDTAQPTIPNDAHLKSGLVLRVCSSITLGPGE